MLSIGQINTLKVTETLPFGYELSIPEDDNHFDDEEQVSILLKDENANLKVSDLVDVFVFTASTGELLATLQSPKIKLNEYASLTLVGESQHGYFFDWGLKPDLYIPASQAHGDLSIGFNYVVKLLVDKHGKLVGTTKIERFLADASQNNTPSGKVELILYAQTPLGFKAVIDGQYKGLLFQNETIQKVEIGDQVTGFIKSVRSDGKIDLSMQPQGKEARIDLTQLILDDLIAHDGLSTITDKSSPDEIYAKFNVSKGAYKKALGNLYKNKKINIQNNCVTLVEKR